MPKERNRSAGRARNHGRSRSRTTPRTSCGSSCELAPRRSGAPTGSATAPRRRHDSWEPIVLLRSAVTGPRQLLIWNRLRDVCPILPKVRKNRPLACADIVMQVSVEGAMSRVPLQQDSNTPHQASVINVGPRYLGSQRGFQRRRIWRMNWMNFQRRSRKAQGSDRRSFFGISEDRDSSQPLQKDHGQG